MKGLVITALLGALLGGAACAEPAPAPALPAPVAQPAAAPPQDAALQDPPPRADSPIAAPAPVERRFGHFPYAEGVDLKGGVCAHADPERTRLKPDAAAALARMTEAARAAGVSLNPSSCFRSIDSQRRLFTCVDGGDTGCAGGRLVSEARRATAVAPPGFSEHATGYAIDFFPGREDLRDAACPTRAACTVTPAFARAPSGRWLAAHAHAFGFEQSFFAGSTQGVMVEPWHYRFVGSPEARAVFREARTAHPPPKPGAPLTPQDAPSPAR
ncbi:MAG: M15 family metallopeptidase [Hyphomonadaceae bacterium]|nr:M15 family metallopeptidase [Hyphomonadaceae bacterium]